MPQHELISTLQSLHAQLNDSKDVDPETRAMLKTITDDIQRLVDKTESSETENQSASHEAKSLREMLIEFEVRHPHLGGLLERLTDGLSSIGI